MTLEEAIKHAEEVAEENEKISLYTPVEFIPADLLIEQCQNCADDHRKLAEWLKILKSAQFEYNEAWRIITHPTPDVTYADRNRAQVILDTFRNSLGVME